jgi:hypothetical protein
MAIPRPPRTRTGAMRPPVAAVSAVASARNFVAQTDIQIPKIELQVTIAAGTPAPAVTVPKTKPALA